MTDRSSSGAVAAFRKQLETLVPAWFEADQELGRQLSDEDGARDEEPSIDEALGKPCTARELDALETRLGRPLPASYRAYLTLYGSGPKSFGTPLGPAEHRSKDLRDAMRSKSGLFDEFEETNPIALGAIPFIADGDSRELVLFAPSKRKKGQMDVVEYDIVEEQRRHPDLVAYFRRSLATTRECVKEQTKEKGRRGIRTVRQAIDAVVDFGVTKDISKTALKASFLRLGGQLPGGSIPTDATIKELRDARESERFCRALRALPGLPERLVLALVDAANDLLDQREHRAKALPVLELIFDVAPKKPRKARDETYAWWLEILNSALHRTFAAKETALGARLADLSRPHARANAFIPHNAACAYAAVGRYDDALAMCRIAVDIGYAHLDRLAKDKDLGALLRRREFKALFA